jgi:hypothetical protein
MQGKNQYFSRTSLFLLYKEADKGKITVASGTFLKTFIGFVRIFRLIFV